MAHRAGATAKSICFDGRAFAVFGIFGTALLRALFAEHGDAEVPDFVVDLAEGGLGKFVSRDAMADRGQIVARGESRVDLFRRFCAALKGGGFDDSAFLAASSSFKITYDSFCQPLGLNEIFGFVARGPISACETKS